MPPRPPLPDWVDREGAVLVDAQRATRVLGAVTPENAAAERARLVRQAEAGRPVVPAWTYARNDRADTRRALEASCARLERERGVLARLHLETARELLLEARIAEAAGTAAIGPLAEARFGDPLGADGADAALATSRARAWVAEEPSTEARGVISSDARDPGSLVSRLRARVAALGLPFEVVAHPGLASLAAVGERQIFVAEGRPLSARDVERIVVHEIEGHARPRARAANRGLAILIAGTAKGACDQEGYALVLEERGGFLSSARRRELGARHLVVGAMRGGATFADAVQAVIGWGLPPRDAVLVAERAFRGGTGASPGLGRERVYIEAYLRVKARLDAHAADEEVLAAGQIAVREIEAVRGLL